MTLSMDEIRSKAANKVADAAVALANRVAQKGRAEVEPGKKPKAGWILKNDRGFESLINPEKLREAIVYYEIASSIASDQDGGFTYQKALLLEELGDFAEAEKAYLESRDPMVGMYQALPQSTSNTRMANAMNNLIEIAVNRCRAKQQGTFDDKAYAMGFLETQMKSAGLDTSSLGKMFDENSSIDELRAHANQWIDQIAAQGGDTPGLELVRAMVNQKIEDSDSGDEQPSDGDIRELDEQTYEQVVTTAQRFADLLLDKKYTAAKAMLHSSISDTTADDLKSSFEALFEGDENFPEIADVYSVDTYPDMPSEDLANVYVTIDSENNEGVSFTVTREGNTLTIREIEWGRP